MADRSEAPVPRKRVPVTDGTILTFDVLRWHPGWEFDCPVCVLRPVLRYSPNGEDAEQMVDTICLDASIDGHIECEGDEDGIIDRQWPRARLVRRWAEARRGIEFPLYAYEATRWRARFFTDGEGELEYEIEPVDS